MGGGLMQLVAYGAQDIFLTGNPDISFFRVVYRRHTNFSIESIEQIFEGEVDFGRTITCFIKRQGDLINRMHLQVKLPPPSEVITSSASANYKNYVNNIGHALIDDATLSIGNQIVDKHYDIWYDIWNELTDNTKSQWKLLGKYANLYSLEKNNDKSVRLYVPLLFWFNRNIGLSLPLIALQYHEVALKINLKDLNKLILTDVDNTTVTLSGRPTEFKLYVDYIFLDEAERTRFAQNSHEYLIEQVQHGTADIINGTNNITLDLIHPVKELIWVFQNTSRAVLATEPKINFPTVSDPQPSFGNDWFNYASLNVNSNLGYETYDHFGTMKLTLNGKNRFRERDAIYFRNYQPSQYHSNMPMKHIYVYSFGLKPEQHQPSGTCNFSRIETAKLEFKNAIASKLSYFAVNYNILRIMSGSAVVAFSN